MSKSLGSIHNITPFSGGTPMSHILPRLPVIQHTFPSLFQPGHHIRHFHVSYTPQLESLYIPEDFLQLYDSCFNVVTLLRKDLEVVDLRYH